MGAELAMKMSKRTYRTAIVRRGLERHWMKTLPIIGSGHGARTSIRPAGLILLALSLSVTACSYRSAAMLPSPNDLPPVSTAPYRVRVADVLAIGFFPTATLDQSRKVGPDGEIQLMLIGRVHVVGRTLAEVRQELTERYAEELVEPQLTVSIDQFSALTVYVGGEVTQQGGVPYRGGLTLVQAIMDAGGFLPTARLSEVVLTRRGPEGRPVAVVANVEQVLRNANFADDVLLAPMDLVYVPRSRIADVNKFMEQYVYDNLPPEYFFYRYRRR